MHIDTFFIIFVAFIMKRSVTRWSKRNFRSPIAFIIIFTPPNYGFLFKVKYFQFDWTGNGFSKPFQLCNKQHPLILYIDCTLWRRSLLWNLTAIACDEGQHFAKVAPIHRSKWSVKCFTYFLKDDSMTNIKRFLRTFPREGTAHFLKFKIWNFSLVPRGMDTFPFNIVLWKVKQFLF